MNVAISHSNHYEGVDANLDITISDAFFNQSVSLRVVAIIP